jgi:hypothetical protein
MFFNSLLNLVVLITLHIILVRLRSNCIICVTSMKSEARSQRASKQTNYTCKRKQAWGIIFYGPRTGVVVHERNTYPRFAHL